MVMIVAMMQVGIMGVAVLKLRVHMVMGVRLAWRVTGAVFVLMVRIMHMAMDMGHCLVHMRVVMAFGQVQP